MNYSEILKSTWPDWELLDELGRGSYGSVYRARRQDLAGTSYAAIKVMTIPMDESEVDALRQEGLSEAQSRTYFENVVRDFTSEIRLMEKVRGYTNIVSIEDYKIFAHKDVIRWDIFIRMELLTPLNRHIAEHPLGEEEIVRLGGELCSALEVCHRANIVHRDIKPENVFINAEGVYKLGDFGVSRNLERHTLGLSRKGTYNYMAPEVYNGTLADADIKSAAKVDIYSLGLMLYRLSNGGRLPFVPNKQLRTPADYRHALERRMDGEALPPPEGVSIALAQVILKACAFNPDQRYASASAMKRALASAIKSRSASGEGVAPAVEPSEPDAAPASRAHADKRKAQNAAEAVSEPAQAAEGASKATSSAASPAQRPSQRRFTPYLTEDELAQIRGAKDGGSCPAKGDADASQSSKEFKTGHQTPHAPTKPEPAPTPLPGPTPMPRPRLFPIFILAVVVVALGIGVWFAATRLADRDANTDSGGNIAVSTAMPETAATPASDAQETARTDDDEPTDEAILVYANLETEASPSGQAASPTPTVTARAVLASASIALAADDAIVNNVTLAAASINGVTLRSGAEFSFNDTVGARTEGNGFVTATNGRGAKVVGGGVAQVASAIWLSIQNLDDIEIVEKHLYKNYNQSYVQSASDAILTDYNSDFDFRFKYTGDGSILLNTYIKDGALICDILPGV